MPKGQASVHTPKARFGLAHLEPLLPLSAYAAVYALMDAEVPHPEAAKALRKRARAGEWEEDIAADPRLVRITQWTVDDWLFVIQHLASRARVKALRAPTKVEGAEDRARGIMREAEAEAKRRRKSIEAETAEGLGADEDAAHARLQALRRALASKLSADEEAELLLSIARGDNVQAARAALAQIQDVLGVKAANVPAPPANAPIFALPEGSGPGVD